MKGKEETKLMNLFSKNEFLSFHIVFFRFIRNEWNVVCPAIYLRNEELFSERHRVLLSTSKMIK